MRRLPKGYRGIRYGGRIGAFTNKLLTRRGYALYESCNVKKRKKYTKALSLNAGHSLLEYLGVVRRYFYINHNLTSSEIEYLLYLYPKTFFNSKDLRLFSPRKAIFMLYHLQDRGLIEKLSKDSKRYIVYKLTPYALDIVENFYKMLSGEVEMPDNPIYNEVYKPTSSKVVTQFKDVMDEMREQLKTPKTDGFEWLD